MHTIKTTQGLVVGCVTLGRGSTDISDDEMLLLLESSYFCKALAHESADVEHTDPALLLAAIEATEASAMDTEHGPALRALKAVTLAQIEASKPPAPPAQLVPQSKDKK